MFSDIPVATNICPTYSKHSLCLLEMNRISINLLYRLGLRLLESRRRLKIYFYSVQHLRFFINRILVSFGDVVQGLRPD